MCSAWIITPCIKLKKSGVHCQPKVATLPQYEKFGGWCQNCD